MEAIKPKRKRLSQLIEVESMDSISVDYPAFVEKIGKEKHQDLIEFIRQSKLQEYQHDLLYIAYKIAFVGIYGYMGESAKALLRHIGRELHEAMQIINSSSKAANIQIIIRNKAFMNEAGISNEWITKKLTKLISEEYAKLDIQPEALIKPKGRKPKHKYLGAFAHILQSYLQNNTYLKAEEGISISNQQAVFIYSFLDILGIVKISEGSFEVDYIRKYINKHRKG